jgi:hypothetical protein
MTGDDLITAVTEAATEQEAARLVRDAPASARSEAADILYVDTERHSAPWVRAAIVSEARA